MTLDGASMQVSAFLVELGDETSSKENASNGPSTSTTESNGGLEGEKACCSRRGHLAIRLGHRWLRQRVLVTLSPKTRRTLWIKS